jgi:hypothetical protein
MQIELVEFIHPRIAEICVKLLEAGYFRCAVLESMTEVEIALREKGLVPSNYFGTNLVDYVLGKGGQHIKLLVPFGEELQDKARLLFRGAFSYYRNYAAHDGEKIDKKICIRVLMLASELLDLVDASYRSFERIGGTKGLIKEGIFKDQQELKSLLEFLEGQQIIEHDVGALKEEYPFNDIQWEAVFDFGLVKYHETECYDSMEEDGYLNYDTTLIGWIELTYLGKKVMVELKKT